MLRDAASARDARADGRHAVASERMVRLSVEQYHRLHEIGVLGDKVELIDGELVYGSYGMGFNAAQIAAAAAEGIDLRGPEPEGEPRGVGRGRRRVP